MSKKVTRLFEGFHPSHYEIALTLDRSTMKLQGSVTITGKKVGRPSQRLTFHQKGLNVTEATVTCENRKGIEEIPITRINHQRTLEEVRLHSDGLLYAGNYTITMSFDGVIDHLMEGVYYSTFKQDGETKKIIATQFESHHAREAFPCIDEPEAKATFDLSLNTDIGEVVIANTPVKEQHEEDNRLQTTFETTPKMSTYLLAFVSGDMQYRESTTDSGVVVRAYATKENVGFTDFALDVATKTLDFYNEYFGIPYPLEKCDLIALPDFASGAMENWGCITFREQCMLVDPENTSLPTKQYVAMVVAHELAHQWFGNLVTMRWWTDLWLNEGFASWIEYLAVDHLFPEWNLWTQFIFDEQSPALKLDALQNTHPIEVLINHPDEIRSIFDTISYSKGASAIHMLEQYLGHTTFRDGLRHYLKTNAYGNTDTTDLWDSLETVSGKPVRNFMNAWTSQAGFPLVRASILDASVTLTQEPFLVNPIERASRKDEQSTLWPIALRADSALPEVFEKASSTYNVKVDPTTFKLNEGQSGFYRVIYDKEQINVFSDRVIAGELAPLDRLGVLSDAFESAKAGYSSTLDALHLLESYKEEDNSVVWDAIATNIGAIRSLMNDETLREDMKPFGRKLVAKQVERLGWQPKEGESHFDSLLRPTVLGLAAAFDDPAIIAEIERRFAVMTKPEDISPDLRGIIYTTVARKGDEKVFEKLLKMHNTSQNSEERVTLSAAITNFKQPALIERALSIIMTDDVRLQDAGYWIAYSLTNRHARVRTWEWLKENWTWISNNMGHDLSFYRMPIFVARCFSDASFLKDYSAFFESVMKPALERSYKQGIEMIQWQSAWRDRDLEDIKKYFAKS